MRVTGWTKVSCLFTLSSVNSAAICSKYFKRYHYYRINIGTFSIYAEFCITVLLSEEWQLYFVLEIYLDFFFYLYWLAISGSKFNFAITTPFFDDITLDILNSLELNSEKCQILSKVCFLCVMRMRRKKNILIFKTN